MIQRISRKAVLRSLEKRFFLRLHMFWILTGTFLAGLLATRILLALEIRELWLRWTISILFAYLIFLILIRLWLWYVRLSNAPESEPDVELIVDLTGHAAGAVADGVEYVGGKFGGGGATGAWGDVVVVDDASSPASSAVSGSSSLDGCGPDEGVVILVFALLIFAIVAAGLYVIWIAPAILGEVAFEAALAAALARRAKRVDRPGWVGHVWRATIAPLIVVLVFAIIAGAVAQSQCPDATRLREVSECLFAD